MPSVPPCRESFEDLRVSGRRIILRELENRGSIGKLLLTVILRGELPAGSLMRYHLYQHHIGKNRRVNTIDPSAESGARYVISSITAYLRKTGRITVTKHNGEPIYTLVKKEEEPA